MKHCRKIFTVLFLLATILSFSTAVLSSQALKQAYDSTEAVQNIEGTLEIRLPDFSKQKIKLNNTNLIEYVLKANSGTVYSLIFMDAAPKNLKTGQRLRVSHGTLKQNSSTHANDLFVKSKHVVIVHDVSHRAIQSTFGMQKTLVMLVNFQNEPADQPWTRDTVKSTFFTTINDMFHEFSYQQTTVVGDVVGWYTVPLNSNASCNDITNILPGLAQTAARNAGVNVSSYTRMVYMFPHTGSCTWAGLGSLGGSPSNAWINGAHNAAVIAHELGHNLGLYHSHSLNCQGTVNTGTCSQSEYGDYADTMGMASAYAGPHFNAYQKERLGWLGFSTSPPVQTVTASGTYTIDPYESTNQNVKALKVEKASNAASKDYYYLEFRQGIGFDQKLAACTDCNFTKGVIIHQANDRDGNTSNVLDMSPIDNNKSKLIALMPGMSFSDTSAPNGGVTILVESISDTGAKVRVTFGATPPPPPSSCVRASPRLGIGPGYAIVKAGQSQEYTLYVWNHDGSSCPPSTFTVLVGKVHDEIPVTWTPQTITVPAGTYKTLSMVASPSLNAPKGYYMIRIDAANAADTQYKTFTTGSLVVE